MSDGHSTIRFIVNGKNLAVQAAPMKRLLDVLREDPMGPGQSWIQLAPKGCSTTIALVTWFDSMRPGGLQGVMLNVTDIERDHRELGARGLELTAIEQQPWGRYAMFSDPDGNGWILRQPPT